MTATAPVAPTKAEPASRSGGQGAGANPGRGGGGPGGGSTGEEEQTNAIAYNNAYMEGRWGLFRHTRAMRLTLSPDAAYGGGMSSRPTQVPNHTAQWPQSETSATPLVTATAPVAPTKAEPASRGGGQGVGATPGRGCGGPGGGSTGEEERPNVIAYNNAYVEGRWGLFRHTGAMRLIT